MDFSDPPVAIALVPVPLVLVCVPVVAGKAVPVDYKLTWKDGGKDFATGSYAATSFT
jgi:hypothetical protein